MGLTCSRAVQYSHADMNQPRVWALLIEFSQGLDKFEANIPLTIQCPLTFIFNKTELLVGLIHINSFLIKRSCYTWDHSTQKNDSTGTVRTDEIQLLTLVIAACLPHSIAGSTAGSLLTGDHLKLRIFH